MQKEKFAMEKSKNPGFPWFTTWSRSGLAARFGCQLRRRVGGTHNEWRNGDWTAEQSICTRGFLVQATWCSTTTFPVPPLDKDWHTYIMSNAAKGAAWNSNGSGGSNQGGPYVAD
jgi:hypothetical protein